MNLRSLLTSWRLQLGLFAASAFFAAAVILLIAASLFTYANSKIKEGVLGNYQEATIHSTILGIEGPAVEERGPLHIAQERCVNNDKIIQVEVSIGVRNLDTDQVIPILTRVVQARAPGCNHSLVTYPLPAEVTPGRWRVEGISRALTTSEIRYWTSEPFQVVPNK